MNNGPHVEKQFLSTLGAMTLSAVLALFGLGTHAVADEYANHPELT
jgi:hypothetical protein